MEFVRIISAMVVLLVIPLVIDLKLYNLYIKSIEAKNGIKFNKSETFTGEAMTFVIPIVVSTIMSIISYGIHFIAINLFQFADFAYIAMGLFYFGYILPIIVLWFSIMEKKKEIKSVLIKYCQEWSVALLVFLITPNILIKTFGMVLSIIILLYATHHLLPLLKKN